MQINFGRFGIAVALGAGLVGIAGCGGGGTNPTTGPTATSTPVPGATPTTSATPVPSGSELLFVSLRDVPGVARSSKLFASSLDGSQVLYIPTSGFSFLGQPTWLPGRRELLYTGTRIEPQNLTSRPSGKTASASPSPGTPRVRRTNRDGTGGRDLLPLGSSEAAVSADGRQVAYVMDAGGRSQIYVASIDGTNRRQITNGPDNHPAWSPDGMRLVFDSYDAKVRNFDLFTVGVDGKNRQRLFSSPLSEAHPQWSPDGQRIIYSSSSPTLEGTNVFVINADGTGAKQLTTNKNREFSGTPRWTPDGRRIVLVTSDQFRSVDADRRSAERLFDTPSEFIFNFDLR